MYFSQTGVALRGAPIHNVLAEPCGLSHRRRLRRLRLQAVPATCREIRPKNVLISPVEGELGQNLS